MKKIYCILLISLAYAQFCKAQFTNHFELNSEKLIASWCVNEKDSKENKMNYLISLRKDTAENNNFKLYNFNNLGNKLFVVVYLKGSKLEIPLQYVDGNLIKVSGSISSNQKEVKITYSVDYGSGFENFRSLLSLKNNNAGSNLISKKIN